MAEQRKFAHGWCLLCRRTRTSDLIVASLRIHLISQSDIPPFQFSIALFTFVDAAVFSKSALNGSDVHMTFIDWIPSIFSALGMLIINSIDKTRLSADNFSYRGDGVAWKARVVLFMGFAAMAGGLAGGVVSRTSCSRLANGKIWSRD